MLYFLTNAANSKLPDGLSDTAAGVPWQCIVEIADEEVTIVFRQTHERSSHDDEFHFVYTVA